MLKSLMTSALGAGLGAGFLAAALQLLLVVPLIAEAELYESGARTHFEMGGAAPHDGHAQDGHTHDHAHESTVAAEEHDHANPAHHADGAAHDDHAHDDGHAHDHADGGGVTRALLTVLSTAATYTGFALFLVAGFALAERAGFTRISVRTGVLWGMAGFAATQLAPAVGLAPELPGSGAAALEDRQLWWMITAILTAAGLAALGLLKGPVRLVGIALIVIPHLIGAPHPDAYAGVAPPELAAHFAARALAVGAIAWLVLGWIAATIWSRETAEG